MSAKAVVLIVAGAVSLTVAAALPAGAAPSAQYVRTVSGKVRCLVSETGAGTGFNGPAVICEASGPVSPPFDQWENIGFLQAPLTEHGWHYHNAAVDSAGNFSFQNGGNIGGGEPQNDLVLSYGRTYHVNGWAIYSTSDGTRFTNDRTGHGMFVSIENVYSF